MTNLANAEANRPKASPENRKVRRILEAARRLFLEKDYDTVSVDAIAHDADVSKATLYAHFSSKEELLLELVKDDFSTVPSLWEATPGPVQVEQGLRDIAQTFTRFLFADLAMPTHRLIMTYGRRFPKVAKVFMASGPIRHRNEIAAFIRAAANQGDLKVPNVELAATQFLSLLVCDLPIRRELLQKMPSKREYETMAASAIAVFLAAYGTPRGGIRRSPGRAARSRPGDVAPKRAKTR